MNHEATIATLNMQLDNCAKDLYEKDKRIAELERQLAEASAPAVERQRWSHITPRDFVEVATAIMDQHGLMDDLSYEKTEKLCEDMETSFKKLPHPAPQAADTDKVREASAWEALRADVLHGVDGLDNDQVNTVLGMIDYYMPTADMAAQAPVREVPGWQPIETAPKDGSHVLCYAPELQFVGFYGDPINKWCYMAPGVPIAPTQPTHWAPLPAAPVQQEGDL